MYRTNKEKWQIHSISHKKSIILGPWVSTEHNWWQEFLLQISECHCNSVRAPNPWAGPFLTSICVWAIMNRKQDLITRHLSHFWYFFNYLSFIHFWGVLVTTQFHNASNYKLKHTKFDLSRMMHSKQTDPHWQLLCLSPMISLFLVPIQLYCTTCQKTACPPYCNVLPSLQEKISFV